ncbi:MAG: hypothetical protein ACHQ51_03495 [Elusimicrobiota bacterium]
MNGLPPLLAFLAFFAGMWAGISLLISRISGWSSLAARYPAESRPDGERLTWASARLNGVSFKSCLNMTLGPSGFYAVPALPFRLFMPAFLVPWTDVGFAGFQEILFWRFPVFRLGGAEGPVLILFGKTGARFAPYLNDENRRRYDMDARFEGVPVDKKLLLVALIAAVIGLAAALLAGKR